MELPPRDHRIALAEAAKLTKRHRDANPGKVTSGAFRKDQLVALLNQKGCVGVRLHLGLQESGEPAVVVTGIDAEANDLTGGVVLEQWYPCPPFCSTPNPLTT